MAVGSLGTSIAAGASGKQNLKLLDAQRKKMEQLRQEESKPSIYNSDTQYALNRLDEYAKTARERRAATAAISGATPERNIASEQAIF